MRSPNARSSRGEEQMGRLPPAMQKKQKSTMYKGNGIDSKLLRDLKRPGVAYVEGGYVPILLLIFVASGAK